MALNKVNVTTEWQLVLTTEDVAIWCNQLANVNFATGETSPDETGNFDLLLAGLQNKIFIKAGASLWLRTQNEAGSSLFYSSDIFSGAGSSSDKDGVYDFIIDGDNTSDANDVQAYYSRYTKIGNTISASITIRFVPTSESPQIAFNANFSTGVFYGIDSANGPATVRLIGDPAGDNASCDVFSIDQTSSIGLALSTPAFDGAKGYEIELYCSYVPAYLPPIPEFIAMWDTTENGDLPDNATIALPLVELGEYDFHIDWGDGNTDHITAWDQSEVSHTYSAPGTYTTQIRGTIKGWNFRQNYTNPAALIDIQQWGCLQWDIDNAYNGGYFYDTYYLNAITASDVPNLTGVTSFYQAFWSSAITTINNLALWTFSAVTTLEEAFAYCWQLNDPGLNYLDVSNVTTMRYTFESCEALNVLLNLWSTGSCTDMAYMLESCSSYNQSLITFNMHSVETTEYMMSDCAAFNSDPWVLYLPNCRNMSNTFAYCPLFNKAFTTSGPITTPQVEDFSQFLAYDESFNQSIDALDVSACKYFDEIVRGCIVFDKPMPSWVTSNSLSFGGSFQACHAFNQDISHFDYTSCENVAGMLLQAYAYNIPLIINGAVKDFSVMLAESGYNQSLSGINFSSAIFMNGFLQSNTVFNQPIGTLNAPNCQEYINFLRFATAFDQDCGGINITSATDLSRFLQGVTLSTANYNSTLHGFDLQGPLYNVPFDGGGSKYDGIGAISRALLVSSYNWTITDGGPA